MHATTLIEPFKVRLERCFMSTHDSIVQPEYGLNTTTVVLGSP